MTISLFVILLILSISHLISIDRKNYDKLKLYSLFWAFIPLISFNFYIIFYNNMESFQFINEINWLVTPSYLSWNNFILGIDSISIFFIELTLILIPICLIISLNAINFLFKEFIILIYFTLFLLIIVFSVLDFISFYIIFEITLIPIFLIIGIWGSRIEKIQASFYFFFYTLVGSLLMLLSIFKLFKITGSVDYLSYIQLETNHKNLNWIYIGLFLGFAVKIPMFPLHLWLPKAHVEAPIAGSILLAGILLKIGGYGFLRFFLGAVSQQNLFFSPFVVTLSIIAILYGALATLRQNDIKKLIAYSSISHMGLVTINIFIKTTLSLLASLLMMFAHGIVSSSLFIASVILYKRFGSRTLKYYKGLSSTMPLFSILVLILILANIAFPLTLNFLSELFTIKSAFHFSFFSGILLCLGCFVTTLYSLFFYNRIFFGFSSFYLKYIRDLSRLELNTLVISLLFILYLGIFPNYLFSYLTISTYFITSL